MVHSGLILVRRVRVVQSSTNYSVGGLRLPHHSPWGVATSYHVEQANAELHPRHTPNRLDTLTGCVAGVALHEKPQPGPGVARLSRWRS